MKRNINTSIFLIAFLFGLTSSMYAAGFSSFAANEKISLTGIQSGGQNELLFYRLEKDGSYTLISDTAGKYATETDFKVSKEENVEIYYRFRGSDYRKATYTGEMAKLKLDVGKVQLPHGLGNLTSGMFVYKGQWKTGKMEGTGDWEFIGSGEKYKGAFVNNLFQGEGNFTYNDGRLYIGSWANGKKNGNGDLYFPYEKIEFPICEYGSVKAIKLSVEWKNDSADGIGELTYIIKEYRRGPVMEVEKGILSSKTGEPIYWKGYNLTGKINNVVFTNGNMYEGEIKNGKLSGKGNLKYSVAGAESWGSKKGVWENELFTGRATLPFKPKGYYEGSVVKDVKQGKGMFKYQDGAEYYGNWENDQRSGKGKYTWPNGNYYEGEWNNNSINGAGIMVLKGHSTWKCNWKDAVPADSGEVTYTNGAKYTGGVGGAKTDKGVNYFFEGFGRFNQIFPTEDTSMHNDSSYVGYFHEGLPHGKGEMVRRFSNSENDLTEWTYKGDWVNGKKQGKGKISSQYTMGFESYEGEWRNGLKQGKGQLYMSGEMSESTYTGTWNEDKMVGYGEVIADFGNPEDGSVEKTSYKGQFANDLKNGQGTEISGEGTYTGNFVNGDKSGAGKMVYKNGKIYEGDWAAGYPHGMGVMTLANKTVLKGRFYQGEYEKPFTCRQVAVGTQIWMAENLKVTKFRNGEPIIEAKSTAEWNEASRNHQPAFCYYNNDPSTATKYGLLYNWYAATDPRGLAPEGWAVPSHIDVDVLRDFTQKAIFDKQAAIEEQDRNGINTDDIRRQHDKIVDCHSPYLGGVKLFSKSVCLDIVINGRCNKGTDVYGFGAIRTPSRSNDGKFDIPSNTDFWTTSHNTGDNSLGSTMELDYCGRLNSSDSHMEWYTRHWIYRSNAFEHKGTGLTIRCIKR